MIESNDDQATVAKHVYQNLQPIVCEEKFCNRCDDDDDDATAAQ